MTTAEDVLAFWFDPARREAWFKPTPGFDAEIRERFRDIVEAAGSGAFDDWADGPEGALALLIHQFPRNIFRGTPEAYAFDEKARALADDALARGHDQKVPRERRLFFYLPFEHSEAMADQERSVALFEALGDPDYLDHAERHRTVVERFGRFPHRNPILGRISTPEEQAFLEEPGSSF